MDDNGCVRKDRGEPRGWWRVLGLVIAWGLVGVGAAFVLLYAVPEAQMWNRRLAMLVAFIPYGVLAWGGAAVLFALCGRGFGKALALVALAGAILQLVWASDYFPARSADAGGESSTVLTLNARCVSYADDDLVETLRDLQPDLVVIQGTTAYLRDYLGEQGVEDAYPHRIFFPRGDSSTCATAVYAKEPLAEAAVSTPDQEAVSVTLNGAAAVLVPVDAPGPQAGVGLWNDALDLVGQVSARAAQGGLPVIVAGDFNATREHLPVRRLVGDGLLVDAAAASGSGWIPTFPADRWHPAVIQIDHVLVSPSLEVARVEAMRVGDNAHMGLVARIRVADGG